MDNTFVERLKKAAQGLSMGNPFDKTTRIGPLISQVHRDKVLSYYKRAKEEGAEIVLGGGVPDLPAPYNQGSWIEPTIWTGLDEKSAVIQEEIFGP